MEFFCKLFFNKNYEEIGTHAHGCSHDIVPGRQAEGEGEAGTSGLWRFFEELTGGPSLARRCPPTGPRGGNEDARLPIRSYTANDQRVQRDSNESTTSGMFVFTLWYLFIAINYYFGEDGLSSVCCSPCIVNSDTNVDSAQPPPPPPPPAPVEIDPEPEPVLEIEQEPEPVEGDGDHGDEE